MPGTFTVNVPLHPESAEAAVGDAGRIPLTVAEPDGRPVRGGIVVLHESRAFGDAVQDLLGSLAAEGWVAVAPDLFHSASPTDDGVYGDDLFAAFDAACAWVADRYGIEADRVGVLGFDNAGTGAVTVAVHRPVGAAVSVAARGVLEPLSPDAPRLVDAVRSLRSPWLGLYGDDDADSPPDHVEQLRDAAAGAEVAALVVSYPRLVHRRSEPSIIAEPNPEDETVLDAQERVFEWFDGNLR
ncbi:dienelactone hydrolase family protein [Rhodococcus sp. HNM0569]|uniref:dienelactone hydrolase family protein n=1 Tax=Rhodococcus sp. HNM0569 TaxID=2716340 RepID=UPI00146C719E|nr:dienelactone hydrolase family protein [Rhodococcus sp. HNM0569]NLU83551.1 carboxymethylenebutenolidase [Rhodococcus sp. HNM0569]